MLLTLCQLNAENRINEIKTLIMFKLVYNRIFGIDFFFHKINIYRETIL